METTVFNVFVIQALVGNIFIPRHMNENTPFEREPE